MWEVEPTLYWRVKKDGKWTWIRADVNSVRCKCTDYDLYLQVEPITPEVFESE